MNKLKNGFTLVELLIAIAVGMIIMGAIYAMINLAQKSSGNVGRRVLTQQDSRAVLDLMAMEIGMASFNPKMTSSTWSTVPATDTTCNQMGLATSVPIRLGIQIAGANAILVAMDLNNAAGTAPDSVIGTADNEYISYAYNSANSTITRNVSCGGNEIILGGDGSSTMVRNNATTPVTPLFQYFNVSGTDISASVIANPDAAVGSGGIRDIRRIRINIIADVEHEEKRGTLKVSRRTYTTDVLVRNHAF